jgi:hypothetical protein
MRPHESLHVRKGSSKRLRHFRAAKTTRGEREHPHAMLKNRVFFKPSAAHVAVTGEQSPTAPPNLR